MKENDSNYYLNTAQDYFLRGKYPEAIENYNKFIELEPDNWMPYNNCGIIYDRMKNYDEAIKYFTKAIELQDNIFAFAPFANRASVYYQLKMYDKAISDLDKVLELEPDNENAIKLRNECLKYNEKRN